MTKFQVGFITCAVWSPFWIRRSDIFGSNYITSYLVAAIIAVVMMLIGDWIADKFCKE